MHRLLVCVLVAVTLFTHEGLAKNTNDALTVSLGEGKISFSNLRVHAWGEAFPDPKKRHSPNTQVATQKFAEEDAAKDIFSVLRALTVDTDRKVADFLVAEGELNDRILKRASTLNLESVSYLPKNGVKVGVTLPLLGANGIVDLLYGTMAFRATFPKLRFQETGTSFTSLVIDARGLPLTPALFPRIYDEKGNLIFGVEYAKQDAVRTHGVVCYQDDVFLLERRIRLKRLTPRIRYLIDRANRDDTIFQKLIRKERRADLEKMRLADKKPSRLTREEKAVLERETALVNEDIPQYAINALNSGSTEEVERVLANEEEAFRFGVKPYRIVAWSIRGMEGCDIVISNDDAEIILSNEDLKRALTQCKVVVLID